jgi:cytochrome P450
MSISLEKAPAAPGRLPVIGHGSPLLRRPQVQDELLTILVAGVEAPGATLAWGFHELARHPEVEQRLHDEIDAVLAGRPPGYDDVAKLEYTNRVVKEAMRLYSVSVFMRRAIAPVLIGGVRFPADTEVAYSLHALHRHPEAYPAPHRFDPDRWLPARANHLSRHNLIPFSAGTHQ